MKLKKALNLLDVFSLVTGSIIGAELFILPGLAHAIAGNAVIVSYLLAALLLTTSTLSMAELASAMPKAGADYFIVNRVMGPAVGTIAGLLSWFFLSLKSAIALIGTAIYLMYFIDIDINIIAIFLCIVFIAINLIGVELAGKAQVIMVVGLLTILLLYVALGIPTINIHRFDTFAPNGILPVFYATGFIFVSYGGILKSLAVAEEIKNPTRTIPLALILSLSVVTVFYMLVIFVTIGVLDTEVLHKSATPVTDSAVIFMGKSGNIAITIAGLLAFVTTANGAIMAASRYPLALSRDGLLPQFLSKISERFKTPHVAIFVTGIFILVSLFLNLDSLVKASSTILILTYMLANLTLLIMRESRIQNYQPSFKTPLYPWIQVIGIIGFAFLIFEMGIASFFVSIILIVSGFLVYWFYGRTRTNKEYALLHLIKRLSDKELTGRLLESELKEIIRERDEICIDRFDEIIERATIIDLCEGMGERQFFFLLAKRISEQFNLDSQKVFELLLEREKSVSTMIMPGIAVSDIIIDGEGLFEILIARCRNCVLWEGEETGMHTFFLIITTKDERNFYLRAITAIAQLIHNPNFEKRWLEAKTVEGLKDIILLGDRKRICPMPDSSM
jgi:amino acid transporter/mannitol/fructose-specific phosphotransferase system IIA component (Ntr-type)